MQQQVSDVIAAPFSGGRELGHEPRIRELACECGVAAYHWRFSNIAHLPLYHGIRPPICGFLLPQS